MKREGKRRETVVKCWRCGTPYDFNVKKTLGEGTLRCIFRGARKLRYLQYCKKCAVEPIGAVLRSLSNGSEDEEERTLPVETMPDEANPSRIRALTNRHLFLMNRKCQLCDGNDKVGVYTRKPLTNGRVPLQRDLVALCEKCKDRNKKVINELTSN